MKVCKECGNKIGNNSISKLCRRCCRIGQRHSNWKGRIRIPKGYIFLRIPEHPNANKIGYVLEHVYVVICKKCYMKRRYRANHPLPTTAKTGRDIGGKFIRKIT